MVSVERREPEEALAVLDPRDQSELVERLVTRVEMVLLEEQGPRVRRAVMVVPETLERQVFPDPLVYLVYLATLERGDPLDGMERSVPRDSLDQQETPVLQEATDCPAPQECPARLEREDPMETPDPLDSRELQVPRDHPESKAKLEKLDKWESPADLVATDLRESAVILASRVPQER